MKPVSENLRQRSVRPGPEADLIGAALESGIPTGWRGQAILMREPELPVGCPDVLLLYSRSAARGEKAPGPTERHFRLLHQIWLSGGVGISEVGKLLSMAESLVERLTGDLERFDLVTRKGDHVRARAVRTIFSLRGIVAIEAKMSDWRAGLRQAASNLWFASESYLLVPTGVGGAPLLAGAAQFGLGVIEFDGSKCRRALRPTRQTVPASYGSWLVNEWAIAIREAAL